MTALVTRTFSVDAIAFDLDGTLLDTVHDLAPAVNALLDERGLAPLPHAFIRDLIGKGIANLIARAVGKSRGTLPSPSELDALLARYAELYELTIGKHTRVFGGVLDTLEKMRADGYRLAVITNKATRFVAPHLKHAGIDDYFDAVVGGDDAPAKKPDAALLRLAMRTLSVRAAHMLVVGDSANDALAARNAGCPVVVVDYGYNEGVPVATLDTDGIVASLAELPLLCQRAFAPATQRC